MQVLRACTRTRLATPVAASRVLSAALSLSISSTPEHDRPVPWFVDPVEPGPSKKTPTATPQQSSLKRFVNLKPLPADLPATSPIASLHAQLAASPFLETEFLLVREPIPTEVGPALPDSPPRGRRKRGRTYAGEGVGIEGSGLWRWIVVAQVKEGAENTGAIESVARVVRKSLLTAIPPLPLPPNRKRELSDGWLMIDAGEFAVHIVSKAAREQFFPERRTW